MFPSVLLRQYTGLMMGCTIALGGLPSPAIAQSASNISMREAVASARQRLTQEGYSVNSVEGAPYYTAFLRSGEARSVRVNIPRQGNYVLVVAGDNDTVDLDVYANQFNAHDVSFGPTGLLDFNVYRTGELVYEIDMLQCDAGNCGVVALLLSVGN